MSLIFQPRTDGFRVVRDVDGAEQMIASVCTKGIDADASKAHKDDNPHGATKYVNLLREECTIHSTGGALTVADIEEILANLPTE